MSDAISPVVRFDQWLADPEGSLHLLQAFINNPENWTTGLVWGGILLGAAALVSRLVSYMPGLGGMIGRLAYGWLADRRAKETRAAEEAAKEAIPVIVHYSKQVEAIAERLAPEEVAKLRDGAKRLQEHLRIREPVRQFLKDYSAEEAEELTTTYHRLEADAGQALEPKQPASAGAQ